MSSVVQPIHDRLSELRLEHISTDNTMITDEKNTESLLNQQNTLSVKNINLAMQKLNQATHQIELLIDSQLTCIDENKRKEAIIQVQKIVTLEQHNNILIKNNIMILKSLVEKEENIFKRL
jgi:hypothetical protein